MSHRLTRLVACALFVATVAAACGSSAPAVSSGAAADPAAPQASEPSSSQPTSSSGATATLATSPLDFATISTGPAAIVLDAVPCELAGPVVEAFAASRNLPASSVSANNCDWREGPINSISVHFREVADIDVDERRRLHGADDTVVDESGPGTSAASYLDSNGLTERYFFVEADRAVFIVAETSPPVTEAELRAMADEVAGLVSSAVDTGQYWSSAGRSGEDPLCSVWSADAIAAMFDAEAATPSSVNGCQWWVEGPDYTGHEVTLGIDLYDSIEIYTRNGGEDIAIGDAGAVLEASGTHGTLRQIAFVVGDQAMTVTVDSATHAETADVLADNVASRLG